MKKKEYSAIVKVTLIIMISFVYHIRKVVVSATIGARLCRTNLNYHGCTLNKKIPCSAFLLLQPQPHGGGGRGTRRVSALFVSPRKMTTTTTIRPKLQSHSLQRKIPTITKSSRMFSSVSMVSPTNHDTKEDMNTTFVPHESFRNVNNNFTQDFIQWLNDQNIPWKKVDLFQNLIHTENCHSRKPIFLSIGKDASVTTTTTTTTMEEDKSGLGSPTVNLAIHLLLTPQTLEDCVSPSLCQTMTDIVVDHSKHKKENTTDSSSSYNTNSTTTTTTTIIPHQIIHLHQDVWEEKKSIVQCRLLSRLGQTSSRIYARNTYAKRIDATRAMTFLQSHHLWGATKAKYYYGLFLKHKKHNKNQESSQQQQDKEEPLVAVATFSSRRKVVRNGVPHKSHELVRLCAQRDGVVVGGITKLISTFVTDVQPDDIVTVVDRDWGSGSGWNSIGFTTVHVMPPIVMAIPASTTDQDHEDNHPETTITTSQQEEEEETPQPRRRRRHLVGAGIRSSSSSSDTSHKGGRLGLPNETLHALNTIADANNNNNNSASEALDCLSQHGFYPVYDTGVERLMLLLNHHDKGHSSNKKIKEDNDDHDNKSVQTLWQSSVPTYASSYYSGNSGIAALLRYAEDDCCQGNKPTK